MVLQKQDKTNWPYDPPAKQTLDFYVYNSKTGEYKPETRKLGADYNEYTLASGHMILVRNDDELSSAIGKHKEDNAIDGVKDNVNHPSHYKTESGIEAIDVIEAFSLNFHRGNAVKYILRSGKKNDEVEDLKKAAWYINREIERLTK